MQSWAIKNIKIENPVVLAPMAGVTNQAFREVSKEFGCGLLNGEMVSDKAIIYKNEATLAMTNISQMEHPIALQLFGSEVKSMVEAAIYLDKYTEADLIDINMGCPVLKVVKNGAGSALMKNPELAYLIVKEIITNVSKPVTVKLRSGWDKASINVVEMAQELERIGVSAVAIHPRTKKEMYGGKSNWDLIKAVKEVLSVPVIGNGDIKTAEDALRMKSETNCDAVMIGRGALGNPWLIKDCVDIFTGEDKSTERSYDEIFSYIYKHYQKLKTIKSDKIAHLEMRSHTAWYIAGLPYSTKIKPLINRINSEEKFFDLLNKYQTILNENEFIESVLIDNLIKEFKDSL